METSPSSQRKKEDVMVSTSAHHRTVHKRRLVPSVEEMSILLKRLRCNDEVATNPNREAAEEASYEDTSDSETDSEDDQSNDESDDKDSISARGRRRSPGLMGEDNVSKRRRLENMVSVQNRLKRILLLGPAPLNEDVLVKRARRQAPPTTLSHLPTDVLTCILRGMWQQPGLRVVCKSWRDCLDRHVGLRLKITGATLPPPTWPWQHAVHVTAGGGGCSLERLFAALQPARRLQSVHLRYDDAWSATSSAANDHLTWPDAAEDAPRAQLTAEWCGTVSDGMGAWHAWRSAFRLAASWCRSPTTESNQSPRMLDVFTLRGFGNLSAMSAHAALDDGGWPDWPPCTSIRLLQCGMIPARRPYAGTYEQAVAAARMHRFTVQQWARSIRVDLLRTTEVNVGEASMYSLDAGTVWCATLLEASAKHKTAAETAATAFRRKTRSVVLLPCGLSSLGSRDAETPFAGTKSLSGASAVARPQPKIPSKPATVAPGRRDCLVYLRPQNESGCTAATNTDAVCIRVDADGQWPRLLARRLHNSQVTDDGAYAMFSLAAAHALESVMLRANDPAALGLPDNDETRASDEWMEYLQAVERR